MTISTTSIIKKLLVLLLLFAVLHFGKAFLIPISIGGVLATLFLPLCRWMESKKIPKGLAVTTCLLLFLAVVAAILYLLSWQIAALVSDISLLKEKAINTGNQIQSYLFDNLGISTEKQLQILNREQPTIAQIFQLIAGSLKAILTNFILVMAYIFLLLYYRVHLLHFFLQLAPPAQQKEMDEVLHSIANVSQQYLLGLSKMIVCLWIMYGIGFSLWGVKNALFFSILCGLLEIIPFIGNITGTTLTVLVSAINGASIPILAGIVITYATVQFIQGWVLEPLILGPQVKINPFTTIIALVLGELVWGIPGIFLAIPLIAMVKIIFDHIESLQPYGFLIGSIENNKEKRGVFRKIKNWLKQKRS
jgi:predicted PurR-regulated permease PerM